MNTGERRMMRRIATAYRTLPLLCVAALLLQVFLCGCARDKAPTKAQSDDDVLRAMMTGITEGLEELGRDLEATAKVLGETGLSGDEARLALNKLCAKNSRALIDCAAIDADGIMVTVEPGSFRRIEGTDVSRHRVSKELSRTMEPVLSQVFFTAEKIAAIVFEWPVFSKDGVFMGAASALLDPARFIGPLIRVATRFPVYSGWIAQPDGVMLYSPDPKLAGKNIFKDPYYRHIPGLVAMGHRIAAESLGRSIFRRPGVGQAEFVQRLCLWGTVDVHNAKWRVILVKKI